MTAETETFQSKLVNCLNRDSAWIALTPRTLLPKTHQISFSETAWNRETYENDVNFIPEIRTYSLKTVTIRGPRPSGNPDEEEKSVFYAVKFVQENFIRDSYVENCGNYVSLDSRKANECSRMGIGGVAPKSIPKHMLSQGYLDAFYLELIRDSAEGYFGRIDGQKQFCFIGSYEAINRLSSGNCDVRQNFRKANAEGPITNFSGDWSYMNFIHVRDLEAPRFRRRWWKMERVPRYISTAQTGGIKTEENPEYKNAPFEEAFIFNPRVQNIRVACEINAVHSDDQLFGTCENTGDGMRIRITQGAQPLRTEWGYVIRFRRMKRFHGIRTKIADFLNKLATRLR